jgi:hypothetical protein
MSTRLKNRLEKVEQRMGMNEQDQFMIVCTPSELEDDKEAKERYIEENYPETKDFKGGIINVIFYGTERQEEESIDT